MLKSPHPHPHTFGVIALRFRVVPPKHINNNPGLGSFELD